jgi:nucleotide-binding universal stress UspA family protein
MQTIIVGIDGSEAAAAALEFAAQEASIRHARLRAVAVWVMGLSPVGALNPSDFVASYRTVAEDAAREAQERLDSAWPDVDGAAEAWEGIPADVLISLAKADDLLVVGNRGRGDVASLVLGSVSHHVVRRARCPVVVIPRDWSSGDRAREIHDKTAA